MVGTGWGGRVRVLQKKKSTEVWAMTVSNKVNRTTHQSVVFFRVPGEGAGFGALAGRRWLDDEPTK